MILKSVLTAVTTLLLYTVLIVFFQDSITHSGQTTLQRNIVKAEDYLYEANSHFDTVLVGSSMSERLIMDILPGGCYNLAMAGFSSLDGLQLIKQSEHLPRLIYIEMNTLDRGQTSDAIQALGNPNRQFLNQYLPFLRQKYQPVGVVKSLLRALQYGQVQFVDFGAGTAFDSSFQEKAVQGKLQEMDNMLPDSVIQANIDVAGQYVEAFRRKGVKVIFFETPIDVRLQSHRMTSTVRRYMKNRFPSSQYPTVSVPPDAYQTNDGIHLTQAENIRYTTYLRQHLHQLTTPVLTAEVPN
ncbi:hypothetical protein [Spirosoma validum]|uniref:Uncharacterized protein n=1 Tax=Spirosoma validum TaxID=2771355 RepID=A0A927GBJ8_9BACT|nr:hypothetical protein [Spirosoma validum]MBD2751777.1 hypothetical protein [Spirosoma validum]